MVWRFLRFLGARGELADELTQEVFVAWLAGPPRCVDEDALAAWLRGIARNVLREAVRQRARSEARELPLLDEEATFVETQWRRLESDGRGDLRREALRTCLDSLDGRARRALELHYGEHLGRERTGAMLGIAPEGVKTLLRRTRALLRACIERRMEHGR